MSQEELESPVKSEKPSAYVACPVCHQVVRSRGRYAHFKTAHPTLNYAEYKDKFTPVMPPPTEEKPEEVKEAPLYKGELDTTTILRDILKRHPDIPQRVVNEVCSWAEFGPIHPTQLAYLLSSMRGVSTTTANIVAQKYSLALQKAQIEGRAQIPPALATPLMQTQPSIPQIVPFQQVTQPQQSQPIQLQSPIQTRFPAQRMITPPSQPTYTQPQWVQTQPPPQWYPQPPTPTLTEDKIRNIIRDEVSKNLEPTKETYIDIEEPERDSEGKIILGPDDRPIVRRLHIPASQADKFRVKEDTELKLLEKIKLYKEVFGEKGLDEAKIREIIRQEVPGKKTTPETPPVKPEDVTKAAAEAATTAVQQFIKLREKEDAEERRHKELLEAIQRSASAKTVEGYKEDSMRVLGQGLSEFATIVRERKPVEVVIKEGGKLLLPQPSEKPKIKEKLGESKITELLPPELVEG